jgi:hypothetical protein
VAFVTALDGFRSEVRVLDLETSRSRVLYETSDAFSELQSLDWSPDGSRLLAARVSIDPESSRQVNDAIEIRADGGDERTVAFNIFGAPVYSSTDGSTIATVTSQNGEGVPAVQNWQRGSGGNFSFVEQTELSPELGFISATNFTIPRCSLA